MMEATSAHKEDGSSSTGGGGGGAGGGSAPSSEPPPKPERLASATALKKALYHLNEKFAIGEMHDATEAREALLDALHRAVAADGNGGEDKGGSSFMQKVFSMRMRMTYPPDKNAKKDEPPNKPVDFEQWTQYVLASELREAVAAAEAGENGAGEKRESGGSGKGGDARAPSPSASLPHGPLPTCTPPRGGRAREARRAATAAALHATGS